MKTEIYTNCSLVRVPIRAGETEYYMPQNVEWAKKKIDKLIICAPAATCLDPMDGQTPVMTREQLKDLYINLYDNANNELMHDVSFEQVLHRNNHPLHVDAVLNLSQCRLNFTTAPEEDSTLLLYVFYQTRTEDDGEVPTRSVSVEFGLDADARITLRTIINEYVHALPAKIKGIIFWSAAENPAWLTLRDYTLTYQMADIHSELARPDTNEGAAADSQAALFLLNDLDIDFDYSYIRNATAEANTQRITFLY